MLRVALFGLFLSLACGYAIWRGGAPERIVGGAMLSSFVATLFAHADYGLRFSNVETGVLVIDTMLMVALLFVALRADRGWPLALAGLHLCTMGAHVVRLIDPDMIRVTYALMIAVWSYPMLFGLLVGTHRHRLRLKAQGHDLDWSLPIPARERSRAFPIGERQREQP